MPQPQRPSRTGSARQRQHAHQERRDTALRRVSGITVGLGVGLVANIAGLAVYLGHALPGHQGANTSTSAQAATSNGGAQSPSTGSGSTGSSSSGGGASSSLSAPPSPPVQTYRQPVVSSGLS